MFRIAAFSRIAGVSAKTLRAYDALGLFRPVWVDTRTGYRYYSPAQLPELRRILALRDLGMPLADIRELLVRGGDLGEALARRRAALEHDRVEAERRLAALDITVDVAATGGSAPDVVIRPLTPELVAALRLSEVEGADAAAAFYELESHVRDLGRRANRPPGALIHQPQPTPADVEVYVPLTGQIAPSERITPRRLPACRAACAIHRGPYAAAGAVRDALFAWVDAAGYAPDGPLRILYLQFGAEPELRVPQPYVVDGP
ncbi:MAG: MerR family transcriptional regulator, partial [Chloroflexota bacterium]|nr:MerR family transcriptional regulator [Chloroflexota bacterium]